jgi:hypothetical protein
VIAQVLEVMRLAEEGSEVGRDRVAELGELLAVALQPLPVLREAAQLQRAQPARQPAVNQLPLLVREMDAGERFDQDAQRLEVLLAEGEFAQPEGGGRGIARGGAGLDGRVQNSSTLPSLACREGVCV